MRKHPVPGAKFLAFGIEILYEDRDVIVIDKPPGLLTMTAGGEKVRTAHFVLTDYIRKGIAKSHKRAYIVHRLDRETSGVLIFAKSEEAKEKLIAQWEHTRKKYLAVVHGTLDKKSDILSSYLAENEQYVMYATADKRKGELARTAYRVIKETKNMSLLEVDLLTGKKHQIRVHLANIKHPIIGDKKYGKEDDTHKRLALHALSITFKHPYSGKPMTIQSKIPDYFHKLVGDFAVAVNASEEVAICDLKHEKRR